MSGYGRFVDDDPVAMRVVAESAAGCPRWPDMGSSVFEPESAGTPRLRGAYWVDQQRVRADRCCSWCVPREVLTVPCVNRGVVAVAIAVVSVLLVLTVVVATAYLP
ncbi:hypothetical protein GZL_00807 [Streptomyces sp. 769]|nr:hypothetical protein GZL_00807 [Streptomyces sp. 769]